MVPAQSFLGRTWWQLAWSNNICNIDAAKTQQNNHKNIQAGLLNGTQRGWTAAGPLSLRENRFASLFLLPSEQGTWQHNSLAAPSPVFPVDSTRKLSQEGRNREYSLYSLLATKEGQFCTEEMCCIFFPPKCKASSFIPFMYSCWESTFPKNCWPTAAYHHPHQLDGTFPGSNGL